MNFHCSQLLKNLIIFIAVLTGAVSCNKFYTSNYMKLKWTKLDTNGLRGNLAKGVSASYAALIDGKLIVAGGANFPDKIGYEGGLKVFYNEIMYYNVVKNEWEQIGILPKKMAYGVSVPTSNGALWIGGNTETQSLNTVYMVSLSSKNSFKLSPFVSLPYTMDNFAGCSLDDLIFIGGGYVNGKQSNAFFSINAKTDTTWTILPKFPGLPRIQPVMTVLEQNGKKFVYMLGGFFGGDGKKKPTMGTDVIRYDVRNKIWEKVSEQIDSDSDKPFSLTGATAVAINNRYILCFGGVNYDIFLGAITTQYGIGNDTTTSTEEKAKLNIEFSKSYMTNPIEYYKFNPECRIFDTFTNRWTTIDISPNVSRAGATLVFDNKVIYLIQGELKPGVRSADTWKIDKFQ